MLLFLGWAEFFLGEFALALEHFTRGTAIARRAGSAVLALELMVGEALGLLARGRIAEALDVADGAVEDARPLGSAQSLVWALYAQATVLEAGGDPAAAVRAGEEAVALTAGLEPSSIVAGCGSALAAALVATGEGRRATSVLLELQGGPDLPRFFAGQRAGCYEVLVRAALLTGDAGGRRGLGARGAEAAAREPGCRSRSRWRSARRRARVGCRLATRAATPRDGDAALRASRSSVAATDALGLAVESARGRILAGRALAAAGDRDAAAEQLRAAEGLLVDAPAGHLRAEAVRELRAHRPPRQPRGPRRARGRGGPRGADRARARDRPARRRRPHQPRRRRDAVPEREDDRDATSPARSSSSACAPARRSPPRSVELDLDRRSGARERQAVRGVGARAEHLVDGDVAGLEAERGGEHVEPPDALALGADLGDRLAPGCASRLASQARSVSG